jgi:glycosyltransferase involved in cell wall biosynthesis
MSKIKILFFGKLPPPFNGENIVSSSILNLLNDHCEITIINSSENIEKKLGYFNKSLYYFKQSFNLLRVFFKVSNTVKKEKFDFLYFSGSSSSAGSFSDFILVKLARKHVGKIVCHLHNSQFSYRFTAFPTKYTAPFIAKHVDKFIFLSHILSENLKDHIPQYKRVVSSNPISKELIVTDEQFERKQALKSKDDSFIITYLSNFILSKGYMELVEALELLPQAVKSKINVRFIGSWMDDKTKEQEFLKKISQPDLSGIVEYVGPVYDRIKLKSYLLQSDIFCLPTYYPLEAQPVSIIEAMNAGNAIISTWHASIPEYVESGKDGYLISKHDINALAEAITKLCDRQALNSFSDNVRDKFKTRFNEESILNGLLQIFSRPIN